MDARAVERQEPSAGRGSKAGYERCPGTGEATVDARRLVMVGGVVVWATLMLLELVTGMRWLLAAAIIVIVLQVVLSMAVSRR